MGRHYKRGDAQKFVKPVFNLANAMLPPGLVPAMFSYGFLATAFTLNPALAGSLVLFIFYGIAVFAEHRSQEVNAFHLTTAQAMAVLAGTITGVAFSAATRMPRLVETRAFFGWDTTRNATYGAPRSLWDAVFYPWPLLFLLSLVALCHGAYFSLGGLWRDTHAPAALAKSLSLTIGISLVVAGTGLVVASVVQVSRTKLPNGVPGKLTVKYGTILWTLTFLPPLTYDTLREWLVNAETTEEQVDAPFPWHAIVTLLVIAILHGVSYRAATAAPVQTPPGKRALVDPYFSGGNVLRGRKAWGTLFLIHFFAFATGAVADATTDGEVPVILQALVVYGAFVCFLMAACAAAGTGCCQQVTMPGTAPRNEAATSRGQPGARTAATGKVRYLENDETDSSESGSGAQQIIDTDKFLQKAGMQRENAPVFARNTRFRTVFSPSTV